MSLSGVGDYLFYATWTMFISESLYRRDNPCWFLQQRSFK